MSATQQCSITDYLRRNGAGHYVLRLADDKVYDLMRESVVPEDEVMDINRIRIIAGEWDGTPIEHGVNLRSSRSGTKYAPIKDIDRIAKCGGIYTPRDVLTRIFWETKDVGRGI